MSDPTTLEPRRPRRPARSRRPIPQRRRRHIRVERISIQPSEVVCTADDALSALMESGEIFKVGRRYYMVAPVCEKVLERLIIAAGRTEDDEANGDLEPNTGEDEPDEDNEPTLGWSNPSVG